MSARTTIRRRAPLLLACGGVLTLTFSALAATETKAEGDEKKSPPTEEAAAAPTAEGEGDGEKKKDGLSIPYDRYTLTNGLEVILHRDTRTSLVAVSVWYHVGAFDEPKGRTGFAHLFEHLMFQGSEHVPGDKYFAYLEAAGASVRSGMINGTTNFDRTNYFEVVPMNELGLALWLESDRMGYLGSAISQEKLDEQRAVVKNERLQSVENRPYGLAEEKLWQTVFPEEHPYYGQVIGSLADLDAATLDDVRGFYDDYYAPSNATLTIAGNFETEDAKKMIEKYFGTLPVWEKPKRREMKPPTIETAVNLDFEETIGKLAKVNVIYVTPAIYQPGDADMDVLAGVLTGGKSSRLTRALLYDEEIADSVQAFQYSMANTSLFVIEATVRDGVEPAKVRNAIQAQIEFITDLPPEQREIDRVVNKIETNKLYGLQKIGGFSGKAEQLQSFNHFLGEPDSLQKDLDRYRAVTPDSLAEAVTKYLSPNNRAVLTAWPKGTMPKPAEAAPAEAEAEAAEGEAEPKEPAAADAKGGEQ